MLSRADLGPAHPEQFLLRAHGRRHVLRALESAGGPDGLEVERDVAALLPLAGSVTRA